MIVLTLYAFYIMMLSIKNIRIGVGKIIDPRFDNPKKLKNIFVKGIVGIIVSSISGLFFLYITLIIFFW